MRCVCLRYTVMRQTCPQYAGQLTRFYIGLVIILVIFSGSSAGDPALKSDTSRLKKTSTRHTNVNLLHLLGLEEGISKLNLLGWHLQANFNGYRIVSPEVVRFLQTFYGDFSLMMQCHLLKISHGSLVTIKQKKHNLPNLDLQVDLVNNTMTLRYLGVKSYQRVTIFDVFPLSKWSLLQVYLIGKVLVVRVDCGRNATLILKQRMAQLPEDAHVEFGHRSHHQKGLQGNVFVSTLSSYAEPVTEDCPFSVSDQEVADQPQKGTRLGSVVDRVNSLEQQVAELVLMLEALKTQNSELSSRVNILETCECHPSCSYEGVGFTEGQQWFPELCTVCQCVHGRPVCRTRMDIPSCASPCRTHPCQNAGSCLDVNVMTGGMSQVTRFQCHCLPPFTGQRCQVRQNPCIWPVARGNCQQELQRYYYDRVTQQCLPFSYSGCGGNINNYETIQQCVSVAMEGACCYRTFSVDRSSVVYGWQKILTFCKILHIGDCQELHRPQGGLQALQNNVTVNEETEVVGFYPGLSCQEINYDHLKKNCTVGQRIYEQGENFQLGCQQCTCLDGGIVNCTCQELSVRREIRDMTKEEIVRFQHAVAQLRLKSPDRIWEQFCELYMIHRMHASGTPFFLPWHRYFLRQLEQKLQEIDCGIVLPYFDFTTDVRNFSQAILWQANYFGGNGNKNDADCVLEHPFGDSKAWEPCLTRQFNTSVQLPTQIEIALALASDDFMEMSMCLETCVAYLHAYVGGDMMTANGPYDPVFYAVHAHIDMLYWYWQKRNANKFQFPAAYGSIPLIPFNIAPKLILDSEAALCVTYALPSQGNSCNLTFHTFTAFPADLHTSFSKVQQDNISMVSQHSNSSVTILNTKIDPFGLNGTVFDASGFDSSGYNQKGYNHDGYNREGFDVMGYNRYGYNREGYNLDGFNKFGKDQAGNLDTSGRYREDGFDAYCFNREGLNPHGYDKFGYSVEGYDADYCDFHFTGPFAPRQSLRIFEVLSKQKKDFLMSLPRTCPGLAALPDIWLKQTWTSEIKIISGLINFELPSSFGTSQSTRFCFDTNMFLTGCVCNQEIAICETNPCKGATCLAYPEAKCHVTFCGSCQVQWIYKEQEVNCSVTRDFCQPNPCLHGGSCEHSVWPNEPHLVMCVCPPGYDGHLCQYPVEDVCGLPLSTGSCEQKEMRWFYNFKTVSCEKFFYTGCHGNANNFATAEACEARCMIGACCFREPFLPLHTVGYDSQGYNRYGFNIEGFDRLGKKQTVGNGTTTPQHKQFNLNFDMDDFNEKGFNIYGYDHEGYDVEGFNLTGYNRIGEYDGIIDYDSSGFDPEGFNRAGYNCHGYSRRGYDVYGMLRGFHYKCRATTLMQCQDLESRRKVEIVQFIPGKQCSEVRCGKDCGCHHGNSTYHVGEKFQIGCQNCSCMVGGRIVCICDYSSKRLEVRELTQEKMEKFQTAVQHLASQTGHPSQWFQLANLYASYKPQAVGTPAFLPWNRRFLLEVERALRSVDCSLTLPYYDWTFDAGDPVHSIVWAANMFGGNGGWDECVRYHPFKKYYPHFWTPCLRRRFNESISLPDAVSVQLALNEGDYNSFRLHMELFAKLFQSFVGGHMRSDYAPYDPIFYSAMAYIDKLWDKWQHSHLDGFLQYPPEKRFLPMSPFGESPDDVMDLRVQVCTEYLTLTAGAPCNKSFITHFGYDTEGYDRHGYDRSGYNRDGYNVHGFDVHGNQDLLGKYNNFGYNRHGYSRSGYDLSGFDQFGFYIDSYNLDGFDPQGYDRSGYDRYGFDKQGYTPFGFHRNGSYKLHSEGINLTLFDPYGYNRFGLNKFGFDRDGYDIFGFDYRGLNRQMCNYFYLGPVYINVKRIVEEKLNAMNKNDIKRVHRLCSLISPLPEHNLCSNWLMRNKQQNYLEIIYDKHKQNHVFDLSTGPRNSSVLPDKIWFPVAPDDRFCINTNAFTSCQLDTSPVFCPQDLCVGLSCPGHPTGVCHINFCGQCQPEWYDGLTGDLINCTGCIDTNGDERNNGETWNRDICTICTCQGGMVECLSIDCGTTQCQYPVSRPDQCCPSCQGCNYNGQMVSSGHIIHKPNDPCSHCLCRDGNVECTTTICPDVSTCHSPVQPPGVCCHICLDCGPYADGDVWTVSPCLRCSCQRGEVNCEQIHCPQLSCEHPYTPDGECCPVCQMCFYQDNVYDDGEVFQQDVCTSCICHHGSVNCQTQDCPPTSCAKPVTLPDQCCLMCDLDCDYEDRKYKHKTHFTPAYNPCLNCSCNNSLVRCLPIHCPPADLPCSQAMALPGQCCPTVCPKCTHDGHEYNEGESWPSLTTLCEVCECRSGVTRCRQKQECVIQCTHGIQFPGQCCSQCTDCLYDGQVIVDGEKVNVPGSPCQECLCTKGNLECHTMPACTPLQCALYERQPGQCCPQCIGCDYRGQTFQYGDIVSKTACSQCICHEGQILCTDMRDACPPVPCQNPRDFPGHCCQICEGCDYYGRYYEDDQTFVSHQDPCQRCICQKGKVNCTRLEMECPIPPCTHPARVREQCCPQCRDCEYLRRLVHNGQRFSPPGGDPCSICVCQNGSVTCKRKDCPPVGCNKPVTPVGQCCPECPKCVMDRHEYMDGETFSHPRDSCSTCTCKDGEVSCTQQACPPTPCTHAATLPGECCPFCNFCLYDRRIFRSTQRFLNPNDLCQECICQQGSVSCKPLFCPELTCNQPIRIEGQCCLVCPKQCLYSGHLYNDGETFSSLTSSCDECLCRQGHVHCKRRLCPQVLCQHPGKNGCCFTCNGCSHGDIQVSHGQSFSDPQNTCHICTCQKGEISCQRQPCPATQCSHPALEDCCPVCDSCDYNGLIVQSDTVFIDPQDNCRQCHCLAGNVRCQNQMCAPVKCKHPVKVGCCQDCSACRYKNHHYADNQTFSDPDNQCQECTCRHGTVVCQQRVCPPVTCDNPVQGPCCAECGNCQFQGHLLVDGQKAVHTSDPCKICHCLSGTVLCSPKECPLKQGCRYPVQRECCSLCTDCLYGGIEYKNGSRFSDKVECHVCQCLNGEVDCRHVTCPSLSCTHPAKEHCCPECSSCIYANRKYADGQRFSHPTERCQNCICEKGSVRCAPEDCSQAALCSHPVVVHGTCCPVCGQGCYFHSRIYQEEEKFEHECRECTCSQGNVHCVSLQCPPASCLHPVLEGCCWSCTDCLFESHHYKNGQIVPNSYDRCGECKCQNGSFQCTPRQCAPVDCMNPAPGICCPECIDCQMDGQHYANGQHFPSSDDHCSMCICQFGTVSCERVQCDAANCQNPILDICGCGSCHGCQFAGKKYRDGDIFDYPSDPCQICHCQSGSVNCAMRPCEKTCSHPVQVIGCCPHCSDCLFEGILRRENKSFVSEADPCQECVCRAGNVNCSTVTCPEVTCLKPLHLDHQCCPTCPVCKFFGQTYTDNSSFVHPKDPCNQCTCKEGRVVCEQEKCIIECTHPRQDKCCPQCDMCFYEEKLYTNGESFQPNICKRCLCLDGSVVCEEEKCPALNCLLMEQDPGHCCPKCKGCDYHEVHYMSNTSWLLPDNPCVSCACVGGLVTCMEVECYVPCSNPVTVLGQCCPVCPTCNYNGVSYSEGADFNPSDDPCDQCHCDKGYMQCIHETCPSVANCPSSNIVTPTPGECCPSCAGFSSGCTLADIGKITHPRPEEPCFYCECKEDFSWICMKEQCSVLSCPPDVQVSKPDQCCPLCPACFDKSDAHYYHEGEEWSSLANPCISCLCQGGEIICTSQQCTSPICRVGEQLKLTAGHCCEMCVPVTDSACYYKGKHLESGTEWTVDVCTHCRCDSGAVYCNIQHCSITECGPDEAWVTSPGQCCPVCLKQPGTCVVFGDPHYRTFDGLTLHIQGTCRYVMAADCQKNSFSVEVQHDSRNTPGEVSWAQNFTIRIGTIEVELLQDGIVRVNATVVELPYLYEPYISLEQNSHTVLLTTDIGLQVSWNGDSHAEVSIPGSFKSHVCGLCGNFNGFPHDDLRTRFGQITSSPAVFGNSWKASTQTETCYNSQDVDPCATAGYRIRKIATTRCSVIKGKAFSRCHRQVSPEPYFSSCVYDMCVCLEDPKCLCDILASYAHECARGGIKLEWRSHSLCAFECSEDKGFMFDECGPVCPRTCENFQTPLGNLTANCFKPCVPSCQCTADKVVHDGHCIKPANCPPIHLHTHN